MNKDIEEFVESKLHEEYEWWKNSRTYATLYKGQSWGGQKKNVGYVRHFETEEILINTFKNCIENNYYVVWNDSVEDVLHIGAKAECEMIQRAFVKNGDNNIDVCCIYDYKNNPFI